MLCGADLTAPPAPPEAESVEGSPARTLGRVLIVGLLLVGLYYSLNALGVLFGSKPEEEQRSDWNVQPPAYVPTTEKGEFRRPGERESSATDPAAIEDAVGDLVELGMSEAEARQFVEEYGVEAASELLTEPPDPPRGDR